MNQKHLRYAISGTFFLAAVAHAQQPNAGMGQGLFEQQGANSCSYCHGIDGKGGKVAVAAHLDTPKKWKVFLALGGDAALAKDKAGFLKNMEEATVALIINGAIKHNASFKQPYFDWKKTGGTYNAQMLGLTGAPSAAWLSKYKDKGVTKELAAKSTYLYLQKFDTQGVFK